MTPFGAERAECQVCHREFPTSELDRYLWCPECVARMSRRAARWGRGAGLAVALGLALWIALAIRPGPEYRWWWALPVAVTYVLVGRIARNIAVGVYRARGLGGGRAADDRAL